MSTLPVRYTNNHHVAPSKTASPIVVAMNKAALATCVQSAYHHRHQQQRQLQQQQQQHIQRHHHMTPPVKRHPTKMAAARRAKSRSRSRATSGSASGAGSPAKRRNGNAKKKMQQQQQQLMSKSQSQEAGEEQQNPLTAHEMVLDVADGASIATTSEVTATAEVVSGGETGRTTLAGEWSATLVGGDVLRTPDAAACDRLLAATEELQQGIVKDNEKAIEVAGAELEQQQSQQSHVNNDNLMDTSEAMDESDSALPSTSSSSDLGTSCAAMGDVVDTPVLAPRRNNEELFAELQEALALEPKYQPSLYLPHSSQEGEITIGARDGAAHVLRCLKVWYELPTDVLFAAISLVDRFLAKMKVKPKHLACISVGSLYLAAEQLLGTKMNTEDLALISQCRCTAGDLERMAGIISNKLGVQSGVAPVTALTFIRLFYHLFRNAAYELGLEEFYEKSISLVELEQRVEVLACDANCNNIRPCELALVLICTQMDSHASGVVNQQISGLVDYAIEVQKLARIPDQTFFQSHTAVVAILGRYNSSQLKMPYKQRLVWKLSSRTMRVLRPSNKMTSYLPTIDEHNQVNFDSLSRYRTGSLSSEDDEDWPTSPVVPVFEELR